MDKLRSRWRRKPEPEVEGPAECFACSPTPARPAGRLRVLCETHTDQSQMVSGQSLPKIIEQIESELGGWLEGAPLQWLLGEASVEGRDGRTLRGWTFYVPAIFMIAEDRFGAASWLEFWVADLTLADPNFGCPRLGELSSEARSRSRETTTVEWIADRSDVPAVGVAWDIWAAERLVTEKRESTGQLWPSADDLTSWLSPRWGVLDHPDAERFCESFVDALCKRRGSDRQ